MNFRFTAVQEKLKTRRQEIRGRDIAISLFRAYALHFAALRNRPAVPTKRERDNRGGVFTEK